MSNEDLLLLYSGGLESTFLLHLAIQTGYKPLCLLVDYGQRHLRELEAAQRFCEKLGVRYYRVKVELPVRSALTSEEQALYGGVSEWYVPARNTIFLGLAASIAESEGIDTIWYGASYTDRVNRFPDCYQEWVVSANELLAKGLSKPVRLVAPLLGWPKDLVQRAAEAFGIEVSEVHSGYER